LQGNLPRLAWQAAEVARIEWAVGIPGSVGGAVMNAGALSSCVADMLVNHQVISPLEPWKSSPQQLGYSYRINPAKKPAHSYTGNI